MLVTPNNLIIGKWKKTGNSLTISNTYIDTIGNEMEGEVIYEIEELSENALIIKYKLTPSTLGDDEVI